MKDAFVLLLNNKSPCLSKLHKRFKATAIFAFGPEGALAFTEWDKSEVTIQPFLVPIVPPRSRLSFPVTLP